MKTFAVTVVSLCLLSLTSGCLYEIRDEIMDCEFRHRNHRHAKAAWDECEEVYAALEFRSDFKDGFIDGYMGVAYGGNGCPPSIPPTKYWKAKFQTEEGKCRTNAWFDGYSHGALAAFGDGVADMNRIVARTGRQNGGHEIELPGYEDRKPAELAPMVDPLNPPQSPPFESDLEVGPEGQYESVFEDEGDAALAP